jgi:predicted nucleic acid-binding protein
MSYLLDTNAVSEWVKPQPNVNLIRWMESVDEDRTFISVVSLAELRYGIERLAPGQRRNQLENWVHHDLRLRFEHRVLRIDADVADEWGRTVSRCEAAGRPIGVMDAFLAATVQVHGMTLVTRNVSHFPFVQSILNPWNDAAPKG